MLPTAPFCKDRHRSPRSRCIRQGSQASLPSNHFVLPEASCGCQPFLKWRASQRGGGSLIAVRGDCWPCLLSIRTRRQNLHQREPRGAISLSETSECHIPMVNFQESKPTRSFMYLMRIRTRITVPLSDNNNRQHGPL